MKRHNDSRLTSLFTLVLIALFHMPTAHAEMTEQEILVKTFEMLLYQRDQAFKELLHYRRLQKNQPSNSDRIKTKQIEPGKSNSDDKTAELDPSKGPKKPEQKKVETGEDKKTADQISSEVTEDKIKSEENESDIETKIKQLEKEIEQLQLLLVEIANKINRKVPASKFAPQQLRQFKFAGSVRFGTNPMVPNFQRAFEWLAELEPVPLMDLSGLTERDLGKFRYTLNEIAPHDAFIIKQISWLPDETSFEALKRLKRTIEARGKQISKLRRMAKVSKAQSTGQIMFHPPKIKREPLLKVKAEIVKSHAGEEKVHYFIKVPHTFKNVKMRASYPAYYSEILEQTNNNVVREHYRNNKAEFRAFSFMTLTPNDHFMIKCTTKKVDEIKKVIGVIPFVVFGNEATVKIENMHQYADIFEPIRANQSRDQIIFNQLLIKGKYEYDRNRFSLDFPYFKQRCLQTSLMPVSPNGARKTEFYYRNDLLDERYYAQLHLALNYKIVEVPFELSF